MILLSIQTDAISAYRIKKAMALKIPYAVVYVPQSDSHSQQPLIFFHGVQSVEGMRKKANLFKKAPRSLLNKAVFISCYGAYAPKWMKEKHIHPIKGELTLKWETLEDSSVIFQVST